MAKAKIIDYRTVRQASLNELDQKVFELLQLGWELYGEQYNDGDSYEAPYRQAMVKRKERFG